MEMVDKNYLLIQISSQMEHVLAKIFNDLLRIVAFLTKQLFISTIEI